jgi:hypothetical protein
MAGTVLLSVRSSIRCPVKDQRSITTQAALGAMDASMHQNHWNMRLPLLLLALATSTTCLLHAQLDHRQRAPIADHLHEVNAQWPLWQSAVPHANAVQYASDAERISAHLQAVRSHLVQRTPEGTSADAMAQRTALLDTLEHYAMRLRFPQNRVLPYRNPIFIDPVGTACAVGHLMIASGHGDLARAIQAGFNTGYVHELLKDDRYRHALSQWADEHGFTADELAWIQPAYAPPIPWNTVGGGTNGTVRTLLDLGDGRALVGGSFAQAGGLNTGPVAVLEDGAFEAMGEVLNGEVRCATFYQGRPVLGGSFNAGAHDVAIWNGTAWELTSAFSSKYGQVNDLHVLDGVLHAAGWLSGFAGLSHGVMRFGEGSWELVGQWFDAEILALDEWNGSLVAGGAFTGLLGLVQPALEHVASFHAGEWAAIGVGLDAPVRCLLNTGDALIAGGELYVGSSPTFGMARIMADSEEWESLLPEHNGYTLGGMGDAYIQAIAQRESGLVVGGNFVIAELVGVYGTNVASWTESGLQLEPMIGYMDGAVSAVQPVNEDVMIGGAFATPLAHLAMSDMATSTPTIDGVVELTVAPNPSTDVLHLTLPEEVGTPSGVIATDAQGRILPLRMEPWANAWRVDVSHLSAGAYTLVLDANTRRMRAAFIVAGR